MMVMSAGWERTATDRELPDRAGFALEVWPLARRVTSVDCANGLSRNGAKSIPSRVKAMEDSVPPPLLGTEGPELLGGLMFSGFRKPGGDALGL
jgi:hypothetical protein